VSNASGVRDFLSPHDAVTALLASAKYGL